VARALLAVAALALAGALAYRLGAASCAGGAPLDAIDPASEAALERALERGGAAPGAAPPEDPPR